MAIVKHKNFTFYYCFYNYEVSNLDINIKKMNLKVTKTKLNVIPNATVKYY